MFIRQRPESAALSKSELPKSELVDPLQLKLWKNNPRKNEHAVKKLAMLLCLYGQKSPVIVWRKNRVVYKGNTTTKAIIFLKNLTQKEFFDFTEPARKKNLITKKLDKVLVNWEDFQNEQEAEDYGMADNKASEWSEWDEELLDAAFQQREDFQVLSFVTGFTEEEIKNLQLIPDLNKLQNIKQGADSLSGSIKLLCQASERDELIDWLKEELPLAKFTDVEIR